MKKIQFKLFATMITLAAVLTAGSFEANAQRRSGENNRHTTERRESSGSSRQSATKKSNVRQDDRVKRSGTNQNLKSTRSADTRKQQQPVTKSGSTNQNQNSDTRRATSTRNSSDQNRAVQQSGNNNGGQRNSSQGDVRNNGNQNVTNRGGSDSRSSVGDRNNTRETRVDARTPDGRRNTGRTVSDNRDFYRVDRNDRRYEPNSNYHGSNNYWSGSNRSERMNYNRSNSRYYRNYNYIKHNHWDRNWERYCWNSNSWRDYYRGYNPRSYTYSRYYFHDPRWGHVLRRFDYRPMVFVHNNIQFYCYNGHFFRYRPGIGYILVDLPFGFTFRYLPAGYYERVHINGYAYFRVGNLFFEASPYGYNLVHYPERYYAYDEGYQSPGYYYDDVY